jgi:adenylate cyclase
MHVLWRGTLAQRLRLASGLVLFAFAATHFLNHALGLISLDAMLAFDAMRLAVTRSWPGTAILTAALLVHIGMALARIAQRRTLRLPLWELVQIALGLAIPLLLLPHIVNTRGASIMFDVNTTYRYELAKIWPATMLAQTALLLLVWVHGCIGLHYWLRLAPAYRRLAPYLLCIAVLLPFAAVVGVVEQGRQMALEAADTPRFAALKNETHWPDPVTSGKIADLRADTQITYVALALGAILLALLRTLYRRRTMRIPVQYVAGPLVKAAQGPTLLEVSRMYGIPHLSACGGRGRCSTCRILVLSDESGLQPASAAELATLRSIRAPDNVRLACQARLSGACTVMPLLKIKDRPGLASLAQHADFAGVERDLAVLFIDIRGFTALTENRLAYDVVFILNQFFDAVGQAVQGAGGWINDRAGDGALALFADPRGLTGACQIALQACAEIDHSITLMNVRLKNELSEPLRIAMGLHCGPHVLGRIGVGDAMTMSVVGPAVNTASRLEAVAKGANVQLALSALVARHAMLDTSGLPVSATDIRGLLVPLDVVLMSSAREITARLGTATRAAID